MEDYPVDVAPVPSPAELVDAQAGSVKFTGSATARKFGPENPLPIFNLLPRVRVDHPTIGTNSKTGVSGCVGFRK